MFGGIYKLYSYLFPEASDKIYWEIIATDSPDKFPSPAIIDFLKFYIIEGISTVNILSSPSNLLIIKKENSGGGDEILRFVVSGTNDISPGNHNIRFDFKGNGEEWWPNPKVCPENCIIASATL